MNNTRQIALDILLDMYRNESYSNIILDNKIKEHNLDPRDIAFTTTLVYGVLERKISLDNQLQKHLRQSIDRLKPEVYVLLQLGAYQLLYMNKVPASAAVNESVKLSRENKSGFASGLINAVLRNIERQGKLVPPQGNPVKELSVLYSFPEELVKFWIDSYGEETARAFMKNSLDIAPKYIRVNTLKTTTSELMEKLQDEGYTVQEIDTSSNALILRSLAGIEKSEAFKQGLFHVQDLASQYCVNAMQVKAGTTIYDMCAAPGGKSFTLAQEMENTGIIRAFDIHVHRLEVLNKNAKRLGIINIRPSKNDASILNDELLSEKADFILCDVPCSGYGAVRRKPEIKYKKLSEMSELPKLQYEILKTSSQYLKKGGRLIYSTCTLNPKENEDVYLRFLDENKEFTPVPLNIDDSEQTYTTLFPQTDGTDGFFIGALSRTDG